MKDEVTYYRLKSGDIFTINAKQFFEVFSKSNDEGYFVALKYYRKFIWNRPSTWFAKYIDVLYVSNIHSLDNNLIYQIEPSNILPS